MERYKELITQRANQYLEIAVREELDREKAAYVDSRTGTDAHGIMPQDGSAGSGEDNEPNWDEVEEQIRAAAAKKNTLGYRSRAMSAIYRGMEPLERDEVKAEISRILAERESEPARRQ